MRSVSVDGVWKVTLQSSSGTQPMLIRLQAQGSSLIGEVSIPGMGTRAITGGIALGNRVDVIHPQMEKGVRAGVSGVFREEKTRYTTSSNRREHRKTWFKCVLLFLGAAEPGEPGQSPAGV